MSKLNYKHGDSVHVSDDGNYWVPAFIVGFDPDTFYRYKVKRADCEDEIGYRFCVPSSLYYKAKNTRMIDGFRRFLEDSMWSGIRGNVSDKELISKYLSMQKSLVLQGFEQKYTY